jgi:hypothetical protein
MVREGSDTKFEWLALEICVQGYGRTVLGPSSQVEVASDIARGGR